MRFFAYVDRENAVVFTSSMHGDADPPRVDGLTAFETDAPLDGPHFMIGTGFHKLPPSPSPAHTFNWTTKQWVDPRTLQDIKDLAHAKIESWRNQQEAAGFVFEHAGRQWDGGLVVRQRMQPVLNLLSLPEGFFWTDANNNDVPISMNSLQELANAHETALVIKGFEIHAQQRAMKNALDSASSKEEVESIVIGL